MKSEKISNIPRFQSGDLITDWQLGRIRPTPTHVPKGWELVPLTSVARLESGHTPSRRNPRYWDGNIPWVSLHDSKGLDVPEIYETAQTISALGIANSSARLLPKGTVIFSRTATVGKATVLGREMATSQDFANYVCGPRLYNKFLVYLFRYLQPEWTRLMAGSTHNSIYMPVFRDLQVLLPPFPEQLTIVEALSDIDELISALGELIAKKRNIKQAAMQQLLTGKRRLPGFRGEWELKRFGELFQFLSTANNPRADLSAFGEVGYIHYGDIHTTSTALLNCDSADLPLIDRVKVASIPLIEDGDLVMADASEDYEGIGKCIEIRNVRGRKIVAGLHTYLLRGDKTILADGFKSYLQFIPSVKAALIRFATGISVYGISKNNVRDVRVLLPSVDEQKAIANVLSDMDAEIAALEQKRDKTHAIKQGMMQELLTGKTRLVEVPQVSYMPA